MNKDLFVKQLTKLISFETVSGNVPENSKALDFVKSILHKKALVKRLKNGNAEILIASNTDTTKPELGYMVHMDVVAARPDQFRAVSKGDKLFGRGASDMKFSIPLGVAILNDLIESKSKKSFSLIITTDEEVGGFDGGKFVADNLKIVPKCLIVPDGGDNLTFVNKAKGVCQLILTAKGSPAHASRPWMGKNALDSIIKIGHELLKIYGKNSLKENWNTTLNIGQVQGGISLNQVCPEAVMKLDFRYPESDSIEKITQKVTDIAKKISERVEVAKASTGLPTFTDESDEMVRTFLQSMEKVYKKKIVVTHTYGASDARHFAKYNIPVLMMKPMGGEIHSETEWISISSCLKFFEGLKDFVENY